MGPRVLAFALAVIGLYMLLIHWAYSPYPCVGPELCLPPNPILPPSPVIVAWADLVVGAVLLLIGGISLISLSRRPSEI